MCSASMRRPGPWVCQECSPRGMRRISSWRQRSDAVIISHKYRFIFVKTLKTAGTSIEVFLSQHCGPDDVLTPILPHVEPHRPRNHEGFFNHMPAAAIRDRVGPDVWRGYFKFCVERNPWDKTLSYYHMQNGRQGGALSLDRFLAGSNFPLNHPTYTDGQD